MLIASIRTSGAVISFYVFLCMAYLLFMIGEFVGRTSVVKGGGGLDIVAAFIGYYIAASGVIHRDSS
jgi:succinate-acetate transporter protein